MAYDLDGDELAGLEEGRGHALAVSRDLIARTLVQDVRTWFDCAFEVMTAGGFR